MLSEQVASTSETQTCSKPCRTAGSSSIFTAQLQRRTKHLTRAVLTLTHTLEKPDRGRSGPLPATRTLLVDFFSLTLQNEIHSSKGRACSRVPNTISLSKHAAAFHVGKGASVLCRAPWSPATRAQLRGRRWPLKVYLVLCASQRKGFVALKVLVRGL